MPSFQLETTAQLPLHPELSTHNHQGLSPLRCAVDAASLPCVRLLLDNEVNLNSDVDRSDDGYSPLTVACLSGLEDIARAIVDAGALPQKISHPQRDVTRAAPPHFNARNFLDLLGRMSTDSDLGLLNAALASTAFLSKDGRRALAASGSYRSLMSVLANFNHHPTVVEKVVTCLNDKNMCTLNGDVPPEVALDTFEKALTRYVQNPAIAVLTAKLAESVLAGQWVDVCEEGATVSLRPGSRVRYGKNGSWVERTIGTTTPHAAPSAEGSAALEAISVAATNETFGDPSFGVRKVLQQRTWGADSSRVSAPHCPSDLVDAVVNSCRHIGRWWDSSRGAGRTDLLLAYANRAIDLTRYTASILSGVDVSELVRSYTVPMVMNAIDVMFDIIGSNKLFDSLEGLSKSVDALLAEYVRALPHVEASVVSASVNRLLVTLQKVNRGFSKPSSSDVALLTVEKICGTICVAFMSAITLPAPMRDVALSSALYSHGVGILTQRLLSLTSTSAFYPEIAELRKKLLVSLSMLMAATPQSFSMPAAVDAFNVLEQNSPKLFVDFFVVGDMALRAHAASVLAFVTGTADRRIVQRMLEPDYTTRVSASGHPRLSIKQCVRDLLRTLNPDDVVSAAGVIKSLGFSPAAFEGFKSEGVFRLLRAAANARETWSPPARAAAVEALSIFGTYAGAPTYATTEDAPEPLSIEDLQTTFDVWEAHKLARSTPTLSVSSTREKANRSKGFVRAISDRSVGWNDHLGALLAVWESARAIRVAAEAPHSQTQMPPVPAEIRIVSSQSASDGSSPPLNHSQESPSAPPSPVSPRALISTLAARNSIADFDGAEIAAVIAGAASPATPVEMPPGINMTTLDDGRIQIGGAASALHRDVLAAIGGSFDLGKNVWTLPAHTDLSFLRSSASSAAATTTWSTMFSTHSSAPSVDRSEPKHVARKKSLHSVDDAEIMARPLKLANSAVTSLPIIAKLDAEKRARTLCARNVSNQVTALELYEAFSASGTVVALEFDAHGSASQHSDAYVTFDSTEAAERALTADAVRNALPSDAWVTAAAAPPGAGLMASSSDFTAEIDDALTAVCAATTAVVERSPSEWNRFVLQSNTALTPMPSAATTELSSSRNNAATHLLAKLFSASRGQIYFDEVMVTATRDMIEAAAAVDGVHGRSSPIAADALSIAEWMLKGRGVYEKFGKPHGPALLDGRFYCGRPAAGAGFGGGFAGGKACAKCAADGKCSPPGCQCKACDMASYVAGHAPPPCAPMDVVMARQKVMRVASLVAPIVNLLTRGVDARTASGALLALSEAVRHNMLTESDGLAVALAIEPFLSAADDAHHVVTNALAFLELAGSSHDGMSEMGSVAISATVVSVAPVLFRADARLSPQALSLLVRVLFNAMSRCADAPVLARLIGDGVSVVAIVGILNGAAARTDALILDEDTNHFHWATCTLYNILMKSLFSKESLTRDQDVAVFLHAGVVECLVAVLAATSLKSATISRARHGLYYLSMVSDDAKSRILTACPQFFEDFQTIAAAPSTTPAASTN